MPLIKLLIYLISVLLSFVSIAWWQNSSTIFEVSSDSVLQLNHKCYSYHYCKDCSLPMQVLWLKTKQYSIWTPMAQMPGSDSPAVAYLRKSRFRPKANRIGSADLWAQRRRSENDNTSPTGTLIPDIKKPRCFSASGLSELIPGGDLLSHGKPTLPSAQLRFTAEFGMGSGAATSQ